MAGSIGKAASGLFDNVATAARAGRGVHQLSEPEVSLLIVSAQGLRPNAQLVDDLAQVGVRYGGEVIDDGAKSGDSLIEAIRGGVRNELETLVARWKDTRFPQHLENALTKQEALLPKLRASIMVQQNAVNAGNKLIPALEKRVADLDEAARAAIASGDDARGAQLLGQKLGAFEDLQQVTKRTQVHAENLTRTKTQFGDLEGKIATDRIKQQVLLAEWDGKKLLTEVSKSAQDAMQSLNRVEAQAMTNARQADLAAHQAQQSLDNLINGGVVRVPGAGPAPAPTPGSGTVPIVDDAVQKELDRIKQELGKA